MKYYVVIKKNNGKVVKQIDCGQSKRRAQKVEDGVQINLNHDRYYTDILTK